MALQNRRVQVRLLSHLPLSSLNSYGLELSWLQPILHALTLLDPNGSTTGSHVSSASLLIYVLAQ
jgi:hypothetical protein